LLTAENIFNFCSSCASTRSGGKTDSCIVASDLVVMVYNILCSVVQTLPGSVVLGSGYLRIWLKLKSPVDLDFVVVACLLIPNVIQVLLLQRWKCQVAQLKFLINTFVTV